MTSRPFAETQEKDNRIINMWAGLLSDIPAGWIICDGNNKTPDLRDKFIRGIGNVNDSPGTNSGVHSYTLAEGQLPSHRHTGSTQSGGSHQHSVNYYDYQYWSYNNIHPDTMVKPSQSNDDYHELHNTTSDGAHSHTFSVNNTGSGNSIDNRPAYYEVAFIMKS